ncbi:cupin domain-containing protein [Brachyspira catarrhinii]|uniref:Cupin domain-containing protein n=2 Tax=Brachyspira catarrhinii TaxID=2528966 RepID=A0ABY2TNR7_9SPIR|nr:cupin domain-containing protein [Brachyspira catarrhinii]TKZ30421.1 cupin domain-containing protein [Brachyspira catarrhinii]
MFKILNVLSMIIMTAVACSSNTENNYPAPPLETSLTINGSGQKSKGSEEYFTGDVEVERITLPNSSSHFSISYVTFQAGARSAWHTHPAGQHLIVLEGIGLMQEEDKPIQEFRAGDVLYCPPNVKHWHGASPNHYMKHAAITGVSNGSGVVWMEKVTDEEYNDR